MKFNNEFNRKLLFALLSDSAFYQKVLPHLTKEYFPADAHQWIYQQMYEHYKRYASYAIDLDSQE